MKLILLILILIFSAFANDVELSATDTSITVSMYQLLSTPQNFHNKKVRISGIVRLGNENLSFFVNQSSFDYNIQTNGFWIDSFLPNIEFSHRGLTPKEWEDLSLENIQGNWVTLTATFDAEIYSNGYSGSLKNIESVCILNKWETDSVRFTQQ